MYIKMTPNRNASIFFQKVYLSSLQDNKFLPCYALLKDMGFADQVLCPLTSLGALPTDPYYRLALAI